MKVLILKHSFATIYNIAISYTIRPYLFIYLFISFVYNPLSRAIVYRYIYARKFKLRFHHDGCFDPVLASFLECGLVSGRFYVFRQGSPEPGGLVEEVGPG